MSDDDKITAAVDECLAAVAAQVEGRETIRLGEILASLRADPSWGDGEFAEVKARLTEALAAAMSELNGPAKP